MKWLATAVAIAIGFIVLADYFISQPFLDFVGQELRDWAIVLTAFALILGLANVMRVHLTRIIRRNEPGAAYSAIVLLTFLLVFVTGLLFGLQSNAMSWIFDNVYVPLQGAFFALSAFFLATAAYRALRARTVETTIMLVAALIVFIGQTPFLGVLGDLREWVLNIPSQAGVRGILMGVALGTMATGLRIIVGMDRPHSE